MIIENLNHMVVKISPKTDNATLALSPEEFRELIQLAPVVLFRGFQRLPKQDLLSMCARNPLKELLHWDFGPVMELKEDPHAANYLFSSEAVPFHWDGAFHRVPSYLVFNCIQAAPASGGGETLFCDTQKIWNESNEQERSQWRQITLHYSTEKKAHYGGHIEGPMVQAHPKTGQTILRFAEPVHTGLNPVSLGVLGVSEQAQFLNSMRERIYADENCYAHTWQENDILIADNHRLIHGRRAFHSGEPRHLRRIQIL